MFKLEVELSELEMHSIGHLPPMPDLLHYKLTEIPVHVDCAPEVPALVTSVDIN